MRRISKIIALAAMIAVLGSTTATAAGVDYSDGVSKIEYVSILCDRYNIQVDDQSKFTWRMEWKYSPAPMRRDEALEILFEINGMVPDGSYAYDWADGEEIYPTTRPYVDLAFKTGITSGVGNDKFAPASPVTKEALDIFMNRFDAAVSKGAIVPAYKVTYENNLSKAYTSKVIKGLLDIPKEVVDDYYADGYTIKVVENITPYFDNDPDFDSVIGLTDTSNKIIYIENPSPCNTIIHEVGHKICHEYYDFLIIPDMFREGPQVNALSEIMGDYCKTGWTEAFPEAFECYILHSDRMKEEIPDMYDFMNGVVQSYITGSEPPPGKDQ